VSAPPSAEANGAADGREPGGSGGRGQGAAQLASERPEIAVAAAFAGGIALAILIGRRGR
jgi:hypothetical protein